MQNSCTRNGLMAAPEMKDRFEKEYPAYQPEFAMAEMLKPLMKGIKTTIVLGQWCGDCQLQVPRFYKVLDQAGVNEDDIKVICVDRSKQAADGSTDGLGIAHVPTFIFFANNTEIGRITEAPLTTLESDMVIILENK